MADFLDLTNIQNQLAETFTDIEKSRTETLQTVTQGTAKLNQMQDQYGKTLQGVNKQVNTGYDEIIAAQKAREEIQRNPPILNKIMTVLGNEDYNDTYWQMKQAGAQTKVARAATRLDTATKQYTANTAMVKGNVAAKLQEHGFVREGFSDITSAVNTMSQVLQAENVQRENALRSYTDQQLNAIQTGKMPVPNGMTMGHIEADATRRSAIKEDLAAARALNETRQFDLAQRKRIQVLTTKATTAELEDALQQAKDGGGTAKLYDTEFTQQELQTGLASAQERDRKLINTQAEIAIQQDQIDQSVSTINHMVTQMGKERDGLEFDPNNPTASLDTQTAVKYESLISRIERAQKIGGAQAAETVAKEVKQFEEELNKTINDRADLLPDGEKEAYKSFYFNDGDIPASVAQDAIISFGTEENAVGGIYDSIWNSMAQHNKQRMQEYAALGGKTTYDPTTGSIVTGPKKLPPEVLASELPDVVIKSIPLPDGTTYDITPKTVLADNYLQGFLSQQFADMAKADPRFEALVDPETGALSADQYVIAGDGTTTWDPQVTSNKLLTIYQGDTTALSAVLRKMENNITPYSRNVDRTSATNYKEAALNQIIYGNDSRQLVGPRFREMSGKIMQMGQQVQESQVNNPPGTIGAADVATGPFPSLLDAALAKVLNSGRE